MSARICQFASSSVQTASAPKSVNARALVYEFPGHLMSETSLAAGPDTSCLRGATFAFAAETVAALCLYALWHFWHMLH